MREWRDLNSTLVVAPTGCGKTVIFADIIRRMQPMKAMVIAHREELIWQAREKIFRVTGLECSIEMSELWAHDDLITKAPVILSTVQTQNSRSGYLKRMSRFNPMEFGVLILDECHHSTALTYKNIIYYYTKNPDLRVLGVTATPDRTDEEALGKIFQSVAYDYEILDAINEGWLVPVEQQFIFVDGLDYSHVRTTAGDLNGADLSAVMEQESNLQGVAGSSIEILGSRKAIVFAASVKQAEIISNIFNRHRPGMSDWVCGKTDKESRRAILSRFETGGLQVVCNCGVLTEGFDNPSVEVIVMARPTKSRSLYAQMCGRAMRPLPALVDGLDEDEERRQAIAESPKPSMLIVDFVGNSGRHKLMSSADILGGKVKDTVLQRAIAKAKKSGTPVNMTEAIKEEEEAEQKEFLERKRQEEARKARLVARVRFSKHSVNPFDALEIVPERERGWDKGRVLSEKQKAILLKQGIDPDSIPYVQGRQLLIEIFDRWKGNLCSVRQAQVLKRYGYETKKLTRDDAKKLLDQLAANHWRKPQ